VRDQRAGGIGRQLEPELARLRDRPGRQFPRLQPLLGADVAAGLADGVVESGRDLEAAVLATEEGDGRVGRQICERVDERGQLLLLPPLDAVDDDEAAAERERHRAQRDRDRSRGAGVALEELKSLSAGLRFGERAQPRPPLRDPAVIVAVDQVRGLERGRHGPESRLRAGGLSSSSATAVSGRRR
jgi:hypothetical protein